eukprot:2984128-Rhodomonas_salina.5
MAMSILSAVQDWPSIGWPAVPTDEATMEILGKGLNTNRRTQEDEVQDFLLFKRILTTTFESIKGTPRWETLRETRRNAWDASLEHAALHLVSCLTCCPPSVCAMTWRAAVAGGDGSGGAGSTLNDAPAQSLQSFPGHCHDRAVLCQRPVPDGAGHCELRQTPAVAHRVRQVDLRGADRRQQDGGAGRNPVREDPTALERWGCGGQGRAAADGRGHGDVQAAGGGERAGVIPPEGPVNGGSAGAGSGLEHQRGAAQDGRCDQQPPGHRPHPGAGQHHRVCEPRHRAGPVPAAAVQGRHPAHLHRLPDRDAAVDRGRRRHQAAEPALRGHDPLDAAAVGGAAALQPHRPCLARPHLPPRPHPHADPAQGQEAGRDADERVRGGDPEDQSEPRGGVDAGQRDGRAALLQGGRAHRPPLPGLRVHVQPAAARPAGGDGGVVHAARAAQPLLVPADDHGLRQDHRRRAPPRALPRRRPQPRHPEHARPAPRNVPQRPAWHFRVSHAASREACALFDVWD